MNTVVEYARISQILHCIIPELKVLTTRIYYKQFHELVKFLDDKELAVRNYIVFCKSNVEYEVGKIADYYKVIYQITDTLPEEVLITVVDKRLLEPKINL